MPHLGPSPLRACHRTPQARARPLVVALLLLGCAHGTTASVAPVSEDELAGVRRDSAALRRHVAELEDRVVRLEAEAGHTGARDLPVVRLQPPRARSGDDRGDARPKDEPRPGRTGRSLGDLPNSAEPSEGYGDDEAGLAETGGNAGNSGSYRLVGDRLVQLTKQNAPTRPDRPARDAAGNAILTEYETAMALYKAGEVAGAERAFELFAKAHGQHDYADNALYWKGEAAYDQQHFDDALSAFTEVVERYGGGNKAPDALLKIGLCYGRLGDTANARDVLSGLVAAYPDARAADLARARLAENEG